MLKRLPENDILQFGLQFYKLIGEDIDYTPKKLYIYRIINLAILIINLYYIVLNCFKQEGVYLVKSLESGITIFHITIKYVNFIVEKKRLKEVIEERTNFWHADSLDVHTTKFTNKLEIITKMQQRILLVVIMISSIYHMLKPYFNNRDPFPFYVWTQNNSLIMQISLLATQYYCIWITTPVVMTYDVTYFAICMHMMIQLRLLKAKISQKSGDVKQRLKICIRHHQLLSRVFFKIQDMYSWMLMLQYFTSLGTACVQLYILSTRKTSTVDTIELLMYLAAIYAEFGFYSIPVEAINSEFSDIANPIYMSTWYDNDVAIQKTALSIMAYSQIPKYLNGCGIIPINVDTFGSLVKRSISLYVVLKNLM